MTPARDVIHRICTLFSCGKRGSYDVLSGLTAFGSTVSTAATPLDTPTAIPPATPSRTAGGVNSVSVRPAALLPEDPVQSPRLRLLVLHPPQGLALKVQHGQRQPRGRE